MRTTAISRIVAGACIAVAAGLGSAGTVGAADTASAAAPDDSSSTAPPATTQMVIAVVVPAHDRGPATPSPGPTGAPAGPEGSPDGSGPRGQLAPTGDQLAGALVFAAVSVALVGGGALLRRRAARP